MDRFTCIAVVFLIQCGIAIVYGDVKHLKIETLDGPQCDTSTQNGQYLKVHYTGTLEDGTQFDSSLERGEPFVFQLGNNEVIKAWDQGLLNMCVGEKRKLTVPPHLGYGEDGAGDNIPGGATLVFEIDLLSIEEAPKPNNVFKDIDTDDDNLLSQDEVSHYIRTQEEINKIDRSEEEAHRSMIVDIFQHEDENRDGFISFEEFSGPKHDEL